MANETMNDEIHQAPLTVKGEGDLILVQFPDGTVKECASLGEAECELDLYDETERCGGR